MSLTPHHLSALRRTIAHLDALDDSLRGAHAPAGLVTYVRCARVELAEALQLARHVLDRAGSYTEGDHS